MTKKKEPKKKEPKKEETKRKKREKKPAGDETKAPEPETKKPAVSLAVVDNLGKRVLLKEVGYSDRLTEGTLHEMSPSGAHVRASVGDSEPQWYSLCTHHTYGGRRFDRYTVVEVLQGAKIRVMVGRLYRLRPVVSVCGTVVNSQLEMGIIENPPLEKITEWVNAGGYTYLTDKAAVEFAKRVMETEKGEER